ETECGLSDAGAAQKKYWGGHDIASQPCPRVPHFAPACSDWVMAIAPGLSAGACSSSLSQTGNKMKYLVPPIVIPALLLIGVVVYGMLRPLIVVGHPAVPATHSQPR